MKVAALTLGPIATNCYLVWQQGLSQALLVDCAGDPAEIERAAKARELEIRLIVITHAHADHFDALAELKKRTGAEVAVHELETPLLADPARNLTAMLGYPNHPLAAERLLHEADVIRPAGSEIALTVLHTPGHTPGSICLLGKEVLFSGDCLFAGGIGRLDFPGADERAMMASLARLMKLDPGLTVYPGHGPATTIGEERESNPWVRGL
jgi:hydroxyacylglutathione hydrolase